MHTRYRSLHLSIVGVPSRAVAYNISKVQSNKIYIRCIASSIKFLWYGSMEWNMEEYFSMEWKIFGMEWKKIASMEYGKIVFHSIAYHALVVCTGIRTGSWVSDWLVSKGYFHSRIRPPC